MFWWPTNWQKTTHFAGGVGEKKGVFTIKQGALSYWTKTRNTIMELDRTAQRGAGKRPLLDPGGVEVSLQWATGSTPHNKTAAAPSVHTQTLHICCTLPPYPAQYFSLMHLLNRYYTHKVIVEKRKRHRVSFLSKHRRCSCVFFFFVVVVYHYSCEILATVKLEDIHALVYQLDLFRLGNI